MVERKYGNEMFSNFLQKIVQDKGFSQFLSKTETDHQVRLLSIIYEEFEELKQQFGDEADYPGLVRQVEKELRLILDRKFVECYI